MSKVSLKMKRCENHPERPGVGVCPTCKRVICAECISRLDGVLICKRCLDSLNAKKEEDNNGIVEYLVRSAIFSVVVGATVLLLYFSMSVLVKTLLAIDESVNEVM